MLVDFCILFLFYKHSFNRFLADVSVVAAFSLVGAVTVVAVDVFVIVVDLLLLWLLLLQLLLLLLF